MNTAPSGGGTTSLSCKHYEQLAFEDYFEVGYQDGREREVPAVLFF